MRAAWGIGMVVVLFAPHAAGAAIVGACDDREVCVPSTGEEWFALGHSLYGENRYRESVAAFERAMQLHVANAPEGAWNVALGYARLGNRKQTLRWLTHARDMGFRDAKAMHGDPALDRFRNDPEFRKVIFGVRHESGGARDVVVIML